MKRQTTMYCKMCKSPLMFKDTNVYCKCNSRVIDSISKTGIPVSWQGRAELSKTLNIKISNVDYKHC